MRRTQVYALLVAAHRPGADTEIAVAALVEAGTPSVAYGWLVCAALVGPHDLYRAHLIDTDAPAEKGAQSTSRQKPERPPARGHLRREGSAHLVEGMSSRRIPTGRPTFYVFRPHQDPALPCFEPYVTRAV